MAEFDRPDTDSPFLSFVAAEFRKRGTPRRLELSKKSSSHPFVAGLGMRVPERLGTFADLEHLDFSLLPEMFVLKFARGWSARGVMPLERIGPGSYFDHLNLRECTPRQIVEVQETVANSFGGRRAWLIEEFVDTALPGGKIPFDYKFYCFNGTVGLIAQYDRNSSPPRFQVFDGAFRPLRPGRDYLIGRANIQPGLPVVPLHAPEMLWWAQHLSSQADAPFVSVDMYDTPSGPVFGEFTYSPGAVHKRMFIMSHQILSKLDALFSGDSVKCALSEVGIGLRRQFNRPSAAIYGSLAGYSYNSGPRGALRLAELYRGYSRKAASEHERAWMKRLSGTWQAIGEHARSRLRRQVNESLADAVASGLREDVLTRS